MLIKNYIETTPTGKQLNLARNIKGDEQDYKNSFSMYGCTAKEWHQAVTGCVAILKKEDINMIRLPY